MKAQFDPTQRKPGRAETWPTDLPVYQRETGEQRQTVESRSCFGDDSWSLHEVSGKPTVSLRTLAFHKYPSDWKETAKRIAWCMLNIDAPVTLVNRPNAMRSRLSPSSVVSHMTVEIKPFIDWLSEQKIHSLSDVTERSLKKYGDQVSSAPISRDYKGRRLWGPTRFWLYAPYLPEAEQLTQPPWEIEGTEEILGPASWSAENKTPPIHPQTMSPLLMWALEFVNEFSDEIISAIKLRDQLRGRFRQKHGDGDKERLTTYLDHFIAEWGGMPGTKFRGTYGAACQFISVAADVGFNCTKADVYKRKRTGQGIVECAPLIQFPSLHFRGNPLREYVDYYEIDELKTLLAAGCMIVIAYLSGMRCEEARGLQRGCCNRITTDIGTTRYEIVAKSYKDALDSEGNAVHGGAIRENPWHVTEPVAKAIEVMERLHGEEYLFSEAAIMPVTQNKHGLVLRAHVINQQIANFIDWCNRECERHAVSDMWIPSDPAGAVTMRRFRRTLAWFIYRQPAGRISLGIQYGHLQGMTSDGYGSRTSTGLRDLFPMEEAFARAELLAEASERLEEGEFVSGPAADRYIAGVQDFSYRFQGKYLTARQAAELLRDPTFRIFDNGMQPVACCYDAAKALCHPGREKKADAEATPNLSRCDPRCPNVARTDSHIEGLRKEIEWQELQAHSPLTPDPLRLRHEQRIATLNATVEKHVNERSKKVASDA